ncbi:hypothetical protein Cni_G19994 [Canna indica]|uniref:Uncharacterized protein n=1 Tax=Canna indica TaxID=4628 RepID=A0AAQ3KLL2_9LILI|nr:hypothetical protein Cni_G19994 [Canna indica]
MDGTLEALTAYHSLVEQISTSLQSKATEDRLNSLCMKADLGTITDPEVVEIKDLKATLDRIYAETYTYWQQRVKRRWLKDEDRNTSYFHLCASHRRKINWISSLQVNGRVEHDQTAIASSLRDFYSGLLGRKIKPLLNIKWDSLYGSPSVDINSLDDPFTMSEVYEFIKDDGLGRLSEIGQTGLS